MKFKNGFTLSEILITLGVIGVVSAMTLPSVINHFQMKSYAVSFKKHYSILQNTINYLQAEENIRDCYVYYPGGSSYKYKIEDCEGLRMGVIEKLKLTKIKNNFKNLYSRKDVVLANGGSSINSTVWYEITFGANDVYVFNDGAFLFLGRTQYSYVENAFWVLDVNGQKGPNKWGYDVFFMTLTQGSNGQIKLGDALASIKEKGGYYPNEILLK